MDLHGSSAISPLSDDSINDLTQCMPSSPVSEQPLVQMQTDFKWTTSKKIPRIGISECSMNEPLNAFLPLLKASNAASTFLTILTVPRNHSVVDVPDLPLHIFDGPALIAAVTKDFSMFHEIVLLSQRPTNLWVT